MVVRHGVTLVGYTNIAGRLPEVASMLYAKNLLNFLSNLWDAEAKRLKIDSDDEIITSSLITTIATKATSGTQKKPPKKKPPVAKKPPKKESKHGK